MSIRMKDPSDDDDLTDMVKELTAKEQRLTMHQVRALSSLAWPAYNAPWWYWLDYFRANKN